MQNLLQNFHKTNPDAKTPGFCFRPGERKDYSKLYLGSKGLYVRVLLTPEISVVTIIGPFILFGSSSRNVLNVVFAHFKE